MRVAERTADVTWEGDLRNGSGTIQTMSGVLGNTPVSWNVRTSMDQTQTTPEELIAAAHASCYAMALQSTLQRRGTPARHLHVTATCSLDKDGATFRIGTVDLSVEGDVPGVDQAALEEIADEAELICPVSSALRRGVEITVKAQSMLSAGTS